MLIVVALVAWDASRQPAAPPPAVGRIVPVPQPADPYSFIEPPNAKPAR